MFLFAPTPAHAQSGSQYGWYPGEPVSGSACWTDSGGAVRCPTAGDDCENLAIFYAGSNPLGYAYVFPNYLGYLSDEGIWVSGLSCANQYLSTQPVAGLYEIIPPGFVGDSNTFVGYAPANGVQTLPQIGGGNCGCSDDQGNPDNNTQNSSPTNPGSAAESTALGAAVGGSVGNPFAGEPVNIATGNMAYHKTDYKTAGQNPLGFTRYYNSRGTFSGSLGVNWRSSYDRYIWLFSTTLVAAQRADGQTLVFNLVGGVWTPDSDVDYTLTNSGSTWTLHAPDDTIETYTKTTTGYSSGYDAQLNTIQSRNGYTKTLAYNSIGQLSTVTDSYSRVLTLTYNTNGTLHTLATPDSTTITYGYSSTGSPTLTSVTFPTSPTQTLTYVYANSSLPYALTGVTDEDSNTYLTWTYDAYGRALTSTVGTGSNAVVTTVAYNDTSGSRTVTNSLGVIDTYSFSTLNNMLKVTGISRAATSTTVAATESFGYDSNGYLNSLTDWNGNQTTYVNNSHGKPTTIDEAVGTSVARTTTIAYDSTFVHLPDTITTPGVTTTFAYDSNGNVHTKTYTDTTTQSVPYSTNGQTRIWTFGYTNFLLTSVQTPRTDVTAITDLGYNSAGALTSITDALGHETNITSVTGGGYPETIVDPNSVTTTLTYDARQRLLTSSVSTSGGARTTTFTVDPTGEITKWNPPDNTYRTYTYDTAHRLTKITDPYSDYIQYTLDALSDTTQAEIESGPTEYKNHTATFDALGRTLTDVGGQGQTTTFTYDKDGNALTIKDGVGNTTTRVFDALNRLSKSTDANSGVAQWTYDAHDRPLTVEDQNSHTTSYVYNGFGDVIQQTSPDTGTTVYHFDNNSNLTSKTDALGIVTNQLIDKLDRVLYTTYPADPSETAYFNYDQTGTGYSFGIGRLTSVQDPIGTLTRAYDERGNLLTEKRTNVGATSTWTTSYTYNPASRTLSTTYPDGTVVNFAYDGPGRVYLMSATPAGASSATTIAPNINHFPFGPLQYISYGNGMTETWFFDLDYRVTGISGNIGSISGTRVMDLNYAYDAANNVKTITDLVNSANSQTLGYDVLNRINTAVSGTGGYGSYTYTFDPVGNLSSLKIGSTTTSYSYASGTNHLSAIGSTTVSTNANGNITGAPIVGGGTAATFSYNNANRLWSASGGGITNALTAIYYDAFGQRFSKTNGMGTVQYFYDQKGELIAENYGGTYTDYVYVDGIPLAVISPTASPAANQIAYVTTDRIGTPQMVFNSASTPTNIWGITYQPFGQGGLPTSSIVNDIRLPGQTYDAETGFHYNLNRDYMPNLGRYLEADPIGLGGGLNPYLYANGNPMTFTDREGLISWNDIRLPVTRGLVSLVALINNVTTAVDPTSYQEGATTVAEAEAELSVANAATVVAVQTSSSTVGGEAVAATVARGCLRGIAIGIGTFIQGITWSSPAK
jgi:RHS repeat-associated protein